MVLLLTFNIKARILLVRAYLFGGYMTNLPRGIRNNNPGNIRWGSNWTGLDSKGKKKDSSFCVFVAPEWGIRALTKLILNYDRIYNVNTVEGIITRYAPSNENDTEAYIAHVCKVGGFEKDEELNVTDKDVMISLLKGIILHENGVQPYSDELLEQGMSYAGIIV